MSTGTGLNVSKANVYVVLEKPLALNVSKASTYVVLEKPLALNVSKANAYVVLVPVNSNPPVWPSFTFNNAVLDSTYAQSFDLSPAASPTTYTVKTGTLPPGLALSNVGADVGEISGTPTTTGTYTFTLLATNNYGAQESQQFSITVVKPSSGAAAPVITGTILGTGTVGIVYNNPLTITGGQSPYTVVVSSGALPPGIVLNTGATTELDGTPTTVGTYNFALKTTDANSSSTTQNFTIVVKTEIVVPTGTGLPSPIVGQAYTESLSAEGGTSPYTFAITSGALPVGLTMSSSGVISGTATTPGTSSFTLTATDANGIAGDLPLTLTVVLPGSNSAFVF